MLDKENPKGLRDVRKRFLDNAVQARDTFDRKVAKVRGREYPAGLTGHEEKRWFDTAVRAKHQFDLERANADGYVEPGSRPAADRYSYALRKLASSIGDSSDSEKRGPQREALFAELVNDELRRRMKEKLKPSGIVFKGK